MANPQIENGHIDIANELGEAFAQLYLSPNENRVLWAILRQTYGWHKKFDRISFTQFEKLTKLNRRHIFDALHRLIDRKIVTRRGNKHKLEYGPNKNYEEWVLLPVGATNRLKNLKIVTQTGNKIIVTRRGNTPLPVEATKSLPVGAKTKEKKENIQKQESFEKIKITNKLPPPRDPEVITRLAKDPHYRFNRDIDQDAELIPLESIGRKLPGSVGDVLGKVKADILARQEARKQASGAVKPKSRGIKA